MRILAFDTAADFCCVLLYSEGHVLAHKRVETTRDQARILAPLTQELLAEQSLSADQIDRFAVATGPGSFTGLRVGLSFARGLSLATGKPVLGFDHFICSSLAVTTPHPLLMVRDSKRADLFACWRENGTLGTPFLATPAALAGMVQEKPNAMLCGDGAHFLVQENPALAPRMVAIAPEAYAANAAKLAAEASNPAQYPAAPVYLRDADVSMPKVRA